MWGVIFLPIPERELRVTARKRSTVWLRVVAALVALLLGAGFLLLSSVTGTSTVNLGRGLFGSLTWLALASSVSRDSQRAMAGTFLLLLLVSALGPLLGLLFRGASGFHPALIFSSPVYVFWAANGWGLTGF